MYNITSTVYNTLFTVVWILYRGRRVEMNADSHTVPSQLMRPQHMRPQLMRLFPEISKIKKK